MNIHLGREVETGRDVWLPDSLFATHLHLIGGTGKGKTTAIEAMFHQLLLNPTISAHFLFDRLGGVSQALLLWFASPYCPAFIRDRVVYIDAAREDCVPTFNPLLYDTPAHGYFKTQRAGEVILRAWASQNIEEMPRLARWVFNAMWAAAQLGLTVADCSHLLMPGSPFHEPLLGALPAMLRAEWAEIMHARGGEAGRILESSRNRLKPFFENPILRCMFGSTRNRLDVLRFLREGKIVLINLAPQNRLSPQLADAIGGMLLNEILATARSLPPAIRYPAYLWLDEFQRFVGPDIDEAIPEVRQLQLKLILSHQSFSQLERNGVDLRSMIWQAQSRLMLGVQGEDADLLGHELAALSYDAKRIKDEVYTKRQMLKEQRIIELSGWGEAEQEAESWNRTYGTNWNRGQSNATGNGWNSVDASTSTVARRFGVRHDLYNNGRSHSDGSSGSETETNSTTEGANQTEGSGGSRSKTRNRNTNQAILPVYETFDELSRRSYYTFEEQAALWAKEIRLLRTGEAVLRLVNDPALRRLMIQRHAPGYLSWDIARILRYFPAGFDAVAALIETNDRSEVFTSPELIERETTARLDRILHPVIEVRPVAPPAFVRDAALVGANPLL